MAEQPVEIWHAEQSETEYMGMRRITIMHNRVSVADVNMRHLPTAIANAFKLAAAPEMLAALEIAHKRLGESVSHYEIAEIRHSLALAVAKAKGEV